MVVLLSPMFQEFVFLLTFTAVFLLFRGDFIEMPLADLRFILFVIYPERIDIAPKHLRAMNVAKIQKVGESDEDKT
jgi:hypothetical protein